MPRCFIALGGNVGDVAETFQQALTAMERQPDVRVGATSGVVRSTAVGEGAGGTFHNAAAEVFTGLSPWELLDALHRVENEFGRVRQHRWGPRTLDLDLIFYGFETIDEPRLRVPHPACWYRRFVLDPLAEIAGDWLHPEKNRTVSALRERLLTRPLRICLAGGDRAERDRLIGELRGMCPPVSFEHWESGAAADSPEPAVIAWLGHAGTTGAIEFESLPVVPRLDAWGLERSDRLTFLRDVAVSALG